MRVKAETGLVRILMKEGVEWVSTFPTNIMNNPCGEVDGIRNFMVRDERYAVAVADGFSRVSNGKMFGVCSVMGSVNSAGVQMAYGALAQAYEDGTPLLCLTDGVPPGIKGRERFKLEEAFHSVTKWSGYINKPERVPEFMRIAYTQLRSGGPAPVLLQIPDGLGMYEEDDYTYNPIKGWRTQGDPGDVKRAVRALLKADRPLIWAGQGVFYGDACQELEKFAELVHVPVLTTLKGKSTFPENHPLSLGVRELPAEKFMHKSDLILTIGVGFSPSKFMHSIPDPSKKIIIQCTVDESDINTAYPINHAVIGDAKLVLQQLITEVQRQGATEGEEKLFDEIEAAKREKAEKYIPLMESDERPINPYRVYGDLMKLIDTKNSLVTHESGNTRDQLSTVYESHIPHGFLGWGNVTTLGFGLGAAIGAKLAMPERQIISVTGDAGIGYQMGNLETLVRYNLGITTIHINNDGFGGYGPGFWGPGHHPYTYEVGPHTVQSTAKIADALGMQAERVEDPDEVAPAIKRALKANASGKPSLIEVICLKYPVYGQWITN